MKLQNDASDASDSFSESGWSTGVDRIFNIKLSRRLFVLEVAAASWLDFCDAVENVSTSFDTEAANPTPAANENLRRGLVLTSEDVSSVGVPIIDLRDGTQSGV